MADSEVSMEYQTGMKKVHFQPYADNGGSIVAISGDDFAVVASDTRLTTGYNIYSREQSKLFNLSEQAVLGCTGCWCDVLTLTRTITARMQMYKHEHQKDMNATAVAQMTSTLLYYKRFFPYYVSTVLAGLDKDGKGVVYSYDPVGHCHRYQFVAGGSAGALLQPLLDNQIGLRNMQNVQKEPISQEKALSIIKDTFISAAERDIYSGDGVAICVIDKNGVRHEKFDLRRD